MVYNTATGEVIERDRCHRLNEYSVFMMLLIVIASLVGIGSVYHPAGVEKHLLQPALASPPGVVETQLLIPPPPPGLPPMQLPQLPTPQLPTPQQ